MFLVISFPFLFLMIIVAAKWETDCGWQEYKKGEELEMTSVVQATIILAKTTVW